MSQVAATPNLCSPSHTPRIIGLDVNGIMSAKVRIETHFISIDEASIDDLINSAQVQVCCSLNTAKVCVNGNKEWAGRGGGLQNQLLFLFPATAESTHAQGPAQGDSYFWTYTIVIANLFAIAVVVFVGMWWRNRNMVKSLAPEGRGDRFTELELFSAPSTDGRLPLSKKD